MALRGPMSNILKFPDPLPNQEFILATVDVKIGYNPRTKELIFSRDLMLPTEKPETDPNVMELVETLDQFAHQFGKTITLKLKKCITEQSKEFVRALNANTAETVPTQHP
jgi:hypothetical protein